MKRRTFALGALPLALSSSPLGAQQSDYPSRLVKVIVPFSPGSASDAGARVFSDLLSKKLNQTFIVENRPGANGVVGIQALKNAPADGYTIGFGSTGMYVNPLFIKNLAYSLNDFRVIAPYAIGVPGFVVGANSPYKTLEDVIAAAKKRGTNVLCGTYTTTYQLGMLWFAQLAGISVQPVLYKGGPEVVNDLMSNDLELALMAVSEIDSLVKEGKLRILATTGTSRQAAGMPDIPTVKEMYPEYEFWILSSFIARVETPDTIVSKLAQALTAVRSDPAAQAYYQRVRFMPPEGSNEDVLKRHEESLERLRQVAKKVGIEPQ